MNHFCPETFAYFEDVTHGDKLQLRSSRTGAVYDAKPEDTLLASESIGEANTSSRFRSTLQNTALDAVNPRARVPSGCENCGRKVVSYQRLGEERRVYFVCLCGRSWYN